MISLGRVLPGMGLVLALGVMLLGASRIDLGAPIGPPGSLSASGVASAPPSAAPDNLELLIVRNAFDASHQPYTRHIEADPPAPVPQARVEVRLLGVLRQGDERVALVELAPSGERTRVRAGDEIAGGTLLAVEPGRLVVEREGVTEIISLFSPL